MPSPFPGMNPYLERAGVWEMFHTQFLSTVQQRLTAQVQPRYRVRMETRVYVHEPAGRRRPAGEADLGVHLLSSAASPPASSGAAVGPTGTLTPMVIDVEPGWLEIEKARFIEIRDQYGREVVTVLELLSPSNKYAGPDREAYLSKRREMIRSRAHFVEIDLLRGGPKMPPPEMPDCDYCAVVSRFEERPRAGVWPWRLRDPMPSVPIPLRAPDPDASLDLKAVLDAVYDAGGYAQDIYAGSPEPRLSPADAAWATAFVPAPPA